MVSELCHQEPESRSLSQDCRAGRLQPPALPSIAVALSGIAFAVILILMQLGFRASLFKSSVRYQEQLYYDIALVSTETLFIAMAKPFSIRRLYQARGFAGVE